jgi:hypothetical protein
LSVGLAGLAAGYCIGMVGDNGVRCYMDQGKVFVGMVLILIFGEVLGLYGWVKTCGCQVWQRRANVAAGSSSALSSTPRARVSSTTLLVGFCFGISGPVWANSRLACLDGVSFSAVF